MAKIAAYSLENARTELCDIICEYQGMTEATAIVVFDAHKVAGGMGSISEYRNITVVFTKEAETADHYIEQTTSYLAKNLSKKDSIIVATSDSLEQIIILSRGAIRFSANDLAEDIRLKKAHLREQYLEKSKPKNNQLYNLIDSDTAEKLEKIRLGSGALKPKD